MSAPIDPAVRQVFERLADATLDVLAVMLTEGPWALPLADQMGQSYAVLRAALDGPDVDDGS